MLDLVLLENFLVIAACDCLLTGVDAGSVELYSASTASLCGGSKLAAGGQAGQICGESFGVARQNQGLQAAGRAGFEPHGGRRDVERLCQEPDKRLVRLAILGNRPDPNF